MNFLNAIAFSLGYRPTHEIEESKLTLENITMKAINEVEELRKDLLSKDEKLEFCLDELKRFKKHLDLIHEISDTSQDEHYVIEYDIKDIEAVFPPTQKTDLKKDCKKENNSVENNYSLEES